MVAEDASCGLQKYTKYHSYLLVWYAVLPSVLATTDGPHSTGQHVLDTPWHQAIAAAAMVSNRKGVVQYPVCWREPWWEHCRSGSQLRTLKTGEVETYW
jgi:hypothetical protein